jgi:hypothetical protein
VNLFEPEPRGAHAPRPRLRSDGPQGEVEKVQYSEGFRRAAKTPSHIVYEVDVPREWWTRAVPLLKVTSMLLKPLLEVGVADLELHLDDEQWRPSRSRRR